MENNITINFYNVQEHNDEIVSFEKMSCNPFAIDDVINFNVLFISAIKFPQFADTLERQYRDKIDKYKNKKFRIIKIEKTVNIKILQQSPIIIDIFLTQI